MRGCLAERVLHARTFQRAIREVELRDIVAKLADVRREREARLVAPKLNFDARRPHANNLKG